MLNVLKRITKILTNEGSPEPLAFVEAIKCNIDSMVVLDFLAVGAVDAAKVVQ